MLQLARSPAARVVLAGAAFGLAGAFVGGLLNFPEAGPLAIFFVLGGVPPLIFVLGVALALDARRHGIALGLAGFNVFLALWGIGWMEESGWALDLVLAYGALGVAQVLSLVVTLVAMVARRRRAADAAPG